MIEKPAGEWVDVCGVDDLLPNAGVCALVGEEQVAIFYLPGEEAIYALNNYDPVGKANVLSRGMIGDIKGEPVVASPLYKQHFSLLSGRCMEDPGVSVKTYSARLADGRVLVLD